MPADRTAPVDRTAPLPPDRSTPPAWSGRAEVPGPRPADYREPADWYAEEPGGRPWWLPILWGVLALLLLALVGGGLWLALRSADDATTPTPTSSPSQSPTRASPTTGAPTTSAAPTSSSPSAPPTTEAVEVPMPPLVNLPLATAQGILDRSGLAYRVEYRTSGRPAGTVLETDPEAGELVSEGEEVTLVVSRGERTPASPTVTPSAEPTPTD
ncbi:PASTA domain-containing protein [Micromonospora sp. NPDC049497]|uniref:PASTA domain-containing protein n=1 Tax=Micromonospora sp. NPDC049497 TaxID=3364273 RepID=UPI0037B4E680